MSTTLAGDKQLITNSVNKFGLALYQHLRKDSQESIFFSPASIVSALAMAYLGARGSTAAEMKQVLSLPEERDRLTAGFRAWLDLLLQKTETTISMANGIWAHQRAELDSEYENDLTEYFSAEVDEVSTFDDSVRDDINQWVEQLTDGMIRELIKPGVLNEDTSVVLVNAIYFKGLWSNKFDTEDTQQVPFKGLNGDRQVELMYINLDDRVEDKVRYTTTDEAQVLSIPYEGQETSMVIFLPREDLPLEKLEEVLTEGYVKQTLGALTPPEEASIWIPKFELECEAQLGQTLQDMGMVKAFSDDADFSGVTDARIKISQVIHKAKVEVDEEGTRAAAATAAVMVFCTAIMPQAKKKIYFRADRPFFFGIYDYATESLTFMGRMV